MGRYRISHSNIQGFTLVELVVVIVITGIVAAMGAAFITKPVEGYIALSRRAELVDAAELALRRMQRDIRQALPNSIRIAPGGYRAGPPGNILDFSLADDRFDVLGQLRAAPAAGDWVVVYNLSASAANGNAYNAAATDNRVAVAAGSSTTEVVLNPPYRFPRSSPNQRFFIVDEAVTYRCDDTVGVRTLTRHGGYAIATAPAIGAGDLLANYVTGCSFTYAPGTSQRAGIVTLDLTIEEQGEQIRLLHQVHVVNAP